MGFLEFPNPADWINSFKLGTQEREAAKYAQSAAYSAFITGLWSEGSAKLFDFGGAGKGLRDTATALYKTLLPMEAKGDLILTVPKELMEPANLDKFTTQVKGQ